MADISARITRKSIKAKKKAAIKTIKAQAKEKIREVKIEYASNPDRKKAKAAEKEQKRALRKQRNEARLAYNERQPRQYSLGEDLFNAISHGIGAGLSVTAIVLLVIHAALNTPAPWSKGLFVTSFSLYGAALFVLYMGSTLYHSITPFTARRVFSIINHIAIYALIAGTYTPFVIMMFSGRLMWVIYILVWSICAFLSILYGIFGVRLRKFSQATYLILGWILIAAVCFSPLGANLTKFTRAMFLAGGVSYSVGSVFYLMRNYKWAHSIFHMFVLAGSILQYFSVQFAF